MRHSMLSKSAFFIIPHPLVGYSFCFCLKYQIVNFLFSFFFFILFCNFILFPSFFNFVFRFGFSKYFFFLLPFLPLLLPLDALQQRASISMHAVQGGNEWTTILLAASLHGMLNQKIWRHSNRCMNNVTTGNRKAIKINAFCSLVFCSLVTDAHTRTDMNLVVLY